MEVDVEVECPQAGENGRDIFSESDEVIASGGIFDSVAIAYNGSTVK